jgi:broad-specificity NMP kinase
MKIKIIRNTVAEGKDVFEGEVVEVSDPVGRMLIQMGKAEEVTEEAKIKEEAKPKKEGK